MASLCSFRRLGAVFGRCSKKQSSLPMKLSSASIETVVGPSYLRTIGNAHPFSTSPTSATGVLDISGIFPPIPTPFVNSLDEEIAVEVGVQDA